MPRGRSGIDQQLLEAALEGLEAQRQRLDDQIRQVRSMIGGAPAAGRRGPARTATKAAPAVEPEQETSAPARRRRPRLSAEARKRIAAAQKKRWAEYRKSTGAKSAAKGAKAEKK